MLNVNLLRLLLLSSKFLQNGIATSSGLLSRSLQIAHGMLEPSSIDCSGSDWHLDRQSPALPNSQFLGMHPPPYGVSTSQLYTSPSQPTLHNSMYNSTYPYHSGWEESYGTCTVASQVSVPTTVTTSFQSPHAYPYSYPAASLQTTYSYSSIMDESPISSPESIDSFTDGLTGNYDLGSQSSLNSPLIDHTNSISNTAPSTMMMNFETQSSYSRMGYSAPVSMTDNQRIQLDTKPLKKAIRMPQSKYSTCIVSPHIHHTFAQTDCFTLCSLNKICLFLSVYRKRCPTVAILVWSSNGLQTLRHY